MDSNMLEADTLVSGLRDAIRDGKSSIGLVPTLLKKLIKDGTWQKRVIRKTGEVATFDRGEFLRFVTTPPLEGLGTNIRILKRLCEDDKEALDLLDQVTIREKGSPTGHNQYNQANTDNVSISTDEPKKREQQHGNSDTYALRKLRKDRPDLHAEVLAGAKSPHGAMVEAGFRKKTISISVSNPSQAAHSIASHFSSELLDELIRALIDEQRNLIARTLQEAQP